MLLNEDPRRFVAYYEGQAGGNLPGFYGAPVMYGRGLGSIFSKLFRFVSPLLKSGFAVVKPHLKTAATNIAADAVKRVVGKLKGQEGNQEGSGGIMVLARRKRKRPPGDRVFSPKKRKKQKRSKSVGSDGAKRRKSARSSDIF